MNHHKVAVIHLNATKDSPCSEPQGRGSEQACFSIIQENACGGNLPGLKRVAWLRDVRQACEKFGIGWCMWTFDGSFGVVNRDNGKAVVDKEVAMALGLNVE